jgi:transposase InsO family protein
MDFCGEDGIKIKFSAARSPQQNIVVERENKIVQEMAKTMLKDSKLGDIFWA